MKAMTLLVFAATLALAASPALAQDEPEAPKTNVRIEGDSPKQILAAVKANAGRIQNAEDFRAVLSGIEKILSDRTAKPDEKTEALTLKTRLLYMASMRHAEDFGKPFGEHVENLEKTMPGSDEAAMAVCFRWVAKNMKQGRFDSAGEADLLAIGKAYPKAAIVGQLISSYAEQMEDEKAVAFLKAAVAHFGDGPVAEQLKGSLLNKSILGSVLDLTGPTMDGKDFNLANHRGKVVLVDFWATWCGPCIAELPHVKKVYEKYKDKGFVVVGISLDSEKDALVKFVKDREIPWAQVIFSKEEEMGWRNPLARKLAINAIPATFLVGKDGKVVARDLRGEEALEKAVAEALGLPVDTEK